MMLLIIGYDEKTCRNLLKLKIFGNVSGSYFCIVHEQDNIL